MAWFIGLATKNYNSAAFLVVQKFRYRYNKIHDHLLCRWHACFCREERGGGFVSCVIVRICARVIARLSDTPSLLCRDGFRVHTLDAAGTSLVWGVELKCGFSLHQHRSTTPLKVVDTSVRGQNNNPIFIIWLKWSMPVWEAKITSQSFLSG